MPNLITLDELSGDEMFAIADRSIELFRDRDSHDAPLKDQVVAALFLMTSTRTRAAFSTAAVRLGARLVTFGPQDLQLNTGETAEDTGRVFSSMFDVLVARIDGTSTDLRTLSAEGKLPVVNAMSADEHPTQGLNDLAIMRRRFGDLTGMHFLYVGEGNNTAVSLVKVLSHIPGCEATFWTPRRYQLDETLIEDCQIRAAEKSGSINQVSEIVGVPDDVDVLYTTRWQTTGTTKTDGMWREGFRPFYVDEALVGRWPAAVVMHDLPAHRGEEIASAVLEGDQSIVWEQAAMKMPSAMAVLESVASRPIEAP